MQLHFSIDHPNPPAYRLFNIAGKNFHLCFIGRVGDSPSQKWRSDDGCNQDHEKDDRIEIFVEHTYRYADSCKDEPYFSARNHSDTDQKLVGVGSSCSHRGYEFAEYRDGAENASD